MLDLKTVNFWIYQGYQDAREGTPYKRIPDYPVEVLKAPEGALPEDVKAYWEGWNAGVQDNARDALELARRKKK